MRFSVGRESKRAFAVRAWRRERVKKEYVGGRKRLRLNTYQLISDDDWRVGFLPI